MSRLTLLTKKMTKKIVSKSSKISCCFGSKPPKSYELRLFFQNFVQTFRTRSTEMEVQPLRTICHLHQVLHPVSKAMSMKKNENLVSKV